MALTLRNASQIIGWLTSKNDLAQLTKLYVGLSSTEIQGDGSGFNEITGAGYQRVETLATAWTGATTSGNTAVASNNIIIQSPTATGPWGNIASIFVASTPAGDINQVLFHGPLRPTSGGNATPVAVNTGEFLQFPSGQLEYGLAQGSTGGSRPNSGMTNEFRRIILDYLFAKSSYDPPATMQLALSQTPITDTGGNFTEVTGGGYARRTVNFNDFSAIFSDSFGSFTSNATDIFWDATGAWSGFSHWALFEGANIRYFGEFYNRNGTGIETNLVSGERFTIFRDKLTLKFAFI